MSMLVVGLGVATSIVAAAIPARAAADVDPVKALQKGHGQTSSPRARTAPASIAASAAPAGLGRRCFVLSRTLPALYVGVFGAS